MENKENSYKKYFKNPEFIGLIKKVYPDMVDEKGDPMPSNPPLFFNELNEKLWKDFNNNSIWQSMGKEKFMKLPIDNQLKLMNSGLNYLEKIYDFVQLNNIADDEKETPSEA